MKQYKICSRELQEKVRSLVDPVSGSMSQAALAKELGCSGATVNTYLSNKFESNVEKFEEKLANYLEFKMRQEVFEENAQSFCPVDRRAYAPISISENVYSAIEYCRLVGGITILHGSAGIGKSMAVQQYKRDNPGTVIILRASESCKTPKQLTSAIAERVGVRHCRRHEEMYARIRDVIDGTKKVIVIDEAHRLPQRSLEDLRDYCEYNEDSGKAGIGIVLIGNTRVMNFISTIRSEEMEQFRNRMVFEGRYHTSQTTLEDIRKVFPLLVEQQQDQELELLWNISRSAWGLRGAVNVYNSAVNRGDISYKGLLRVPESTRIGLV